MECILQNIIVECRGANRYATINQAAKEAKDALENRGDLRVHTLREKTLAAIEAALESRNSRIVPLGLKGLQFILRDNQLQSSVGEEQHEQALPTQVVHTLSNLPSWKDEPDLQCHCLTLLLQLTSSSLWPIGSRIICDIVELCISTFGATENLSVRMAARATVVQTINSYCGGLCKKLENSEVDDSRDTAAADVETLLNYFCEKLKTILSSSENSPPLLLMMDAISSILGAQRESIRECDKVVDLMWKELCPLVITVLGNPSHVDASHSRSDGSGSVLGRGLGSASGEQVVFGSPEVAKAAQNICIELLWILGTLPNMRSILEALYHRMLIFPPSLKRLESLRTLRRVAGTWQLFLRLCTTDPVSCGIGDAPNSDLSLWKVCLDCLVECSFSSSSEVAAAAAECALCFIGSLECIRTSCDRISNESIEKINQLWPTLNHVNGPVFDYSQFGNMDEDEEKLAKKRENSPKKQAHPEAIEKAPPSVKDFKPINIVVDSSDTVPGDAPANQAVLSPVTKSMSMMADKIATVLADSSTDTEETMRVYRGKIRDVWEKQLHIRPGTTIRSDSYAKQEAIAAAEFVHLLSQRLTEFTSVKSTIELDAAILEFACSTSEDFMTKQLESLRENNTAYSIAIYNVDAVYLLSYASLRLLYRLQKSGYFPGRECPLPVEKGQFVDEVLSTGNITYASSVFVGSVYDALTTQDVLTSGVVDFNQSIMADVCRDYDGSDGDFLSDFLRLERNVGSRPVITAQSMAMSKLCRRVLLCSWDGLSKIFCKLIERGNETGVFKSLINTINKNLGKQDRHVLAGVVSSLEALRRMALLCRNLGLQEKCVWIFHKLVETSCPLEELRRIIVDAQENASLTFPAKLLKPRNRWSFHLPHALSMEVILDSAVAVASCAPDCWTSIIRCCEFIFELEHWLFSDTMRNLGESSKAKRKNANETNTRCGTPDGDDDYIVHLISSPTRSCENVMEAIRSGRNAESGAGDEHTLGYESGFKALSVLMVKAERVFEEASRCLNLNAMRAFVKALILASQSDLFYGGTFVSARLPPWSLLQRLSTLLMKLAKSGRPLSHLMHIWGIAAPHFIEASCCRNSLIANRAVSCLHDVITAIISSQFDLRQLHFNEALFQAYTAILLLDQSCNETQDQIVGVIAEVVSMHKEDIHFGWKALFAALRAVRYPSCAGDEENAEHRRRLHTASVDIFENFVSPGDLVVFSLAAEDCLNALLHLLNEPASFDDTVETSEEPENPSKLLECDFGQTALSFLKQYHSLLASLYLSEKRNDVFVHFLKRFVSRNHVDQLIDRNLINMDLSILPGLATMLSEETIFDGSADAFYLEQRLEEEPPACPWTHLRMEQQLVCEALAAMVEGLVGSVSKCPRHLQPLVVEALHDVVVALLQVPGLSFCAYCLNHLVLPMLQNWLRREALSLELSVSSSTGCTSATPDWRENSPTVRNFKQCLGLTVDAVVDVIRTAPGDHCCKFLFAQTLDLLVECIAQPSEIIGRLGCASLRHMATSLQDVMDRDLWDILCRCLWRVGAVTLFPLRLLMSYFRTGSRCYFGDVGRVEVALRKDSNPNESSRMRALTQQVFLLDNQKYEENLEDHPDLLAHSCRSVVFVLHPPYALGENVIKLPFRNIVISLLSHQLWLQLIGYLLLNGTGIKLCGVATTLTRHVMTGEAFSLGSRKKLPGSLSTMTSEHVKSLLLCLDASLVTSCAFDSRPGIKFLVQNIFSSPVPANLYKMAVTSWTFKLLSLYELSTTLLDDGLTTAKHVAEICGDFKKKKAVKLPEPLSSALASNSSQFYLQFMFQAYLVICCRCCELLEKMDERHGETEADTLARQPLMLMPSEFERSTGQTNGTELGAEEPLGFHETGTIENLDRSSTSSIETIPDGDGNSEDVVTCGQAERVYSLASSDTVNAVLDEYKRMKQKTSLPANRVQQNRPNPFDDKQSKPEEQNGDDQQAFRHAVDEATVKDGDAARLAWSEMAASLMELTLRLPDDKFKVMIPCIYPALILMTARSSLPRVRSVIADLLYRLPEVYGFMS